MSTRRHRSGAHRVWTLLAVAILLAPSVAAGSAAMEGNRAANLASVDSLYARRGENISDDSRANPALIASAIEGYEKLLEEDPRSLRLRVRLLRALYFAGDLGAASPDDRLRDLDRALEVGRRGFEEIARRFTDGEPLEDLESEEMRRLVPPDDRGEVAAVYYWTALCWGARAQLTGVFDAVVSGVAGRLRDYSAVVVALAPAYEQGGAHRLRSYLHASLPAIPFVSGWVERDRAVPEAEAAIAIDPDHRGNRMVLALALLDTEPVRRDEALRTLREVVALEIRAEQRAEDLSIRAHARERLAEVDGEGGAADAPDRSYGSKIPDRDGIGRLYMGREISHVMGHRAAGWLERPEREREELPDRVVEEMELAADAAVADVGAGTGYFSFRIAKKVPRGRVFAVDIQPEMLEIVERRIASEKVGNLMPVLGSTVEPGLPEAGVDAVLLVDAYHEFSNPREMLDSIVRALRPGGRVFLVEYRGEDPAIPIKPLHKLTVAQARREFEAAGLTWVGNRDFLPEQHFMIFARPGT
jgi:precorrin-6B methylase 2/tetratricopeptide (TPR) repeat protein